MGIFASILRIIGAGVDFLKDRQVAKNTAAMVQQQTAQNIQADTDEIAGLIRTAHFDPDPKKRAEAFAEIQRRQAVT